MHTILTKRERQIFQYLINNFSTKEIASFLHITDKTVRNHISNTMQKLGVKGRSGAVIELLLLKNIENNNWEALTKPAMLAKLITAAVQLALAISAGLISSLFTASFTTS